MKRIHIRFAVLVVATLFALACGKVDDPNKQKNEDLGGCEENFILLDSLTEESALLGLSGQNLLDNISTPAADATYIEETEGNWTVPSELDTSVTVTVEYDGGEIREYEPTEEYMEICEARLEVEVLITVVSADGLFNETFEGTVSHSPQEGPDDLFASLSAEFNPYDLDGSFSLSDAAFAEADSVDGQFNGAVAGGVGSGQIGIMAEFMGESSDLDGTASAMFATVLEWGFY